MKPQNKIEIYHIETKSLFDYALMIEKNGKKVLVTSHCFRQALVKIVNDKNGKLIKE
jgi:hypothetical protein